MQKHASGTVIINTSIYVVDRLINNPNITAVILAHPLGQDTDQAIVEILYDVGSSSACLLYTVPKEAPYVSKRHWRLPAAGPFHERCLHQL